MAWSWSHSGIAYENAYLNLADETPDDLIEIMTEWRVHQKSGGDDSVKWMTDEETWDEIRKEVREYYGKAHSLDLLIESIWDLAQAQALCDNGGFNAWMCPYGCHTVPFDRNEEEE